MTVRRRKTTDAQLTVPSTKISISLLQGVIGDTVEGATVGARSLGGGGGGGGGGNGG